MENWKKGDVAVCINTTEVFSIGPGALPALRLNSEYIVNDVFTCRCGVVSLDVGLAAQAKGNGTWCSCRISLPYPDVHWCHSDRFVKKMSLEEAQTAYEVAFQNEDYMGMKLLSEQYQIKQE
jgi:hypothetical protein